MLVKKIICFDSDADADLLTWLDGQDNISGAVRAAIRAYRGRAVTLGDVLEAIADLRGDLRGGAVLNEVPEVQEDPELALALDNLGL